ncbi:hypothetical protein HYS00_02175 [Candidatus Microgenomates bacterium]|nr:hypothetical protein [Candidatus Microgenomates bacterium]
MRSEIQTHLLRSGTANTHLGWEASYALKERRGLLNTEEIQGLIRGSWLPGAHAALIAVGDRYDSNALTQMLRSYAYRQVATKEPHTDLLQRDRIMSYHEQEFIHDFDNLCDRPQWYEDLTDNFSEQTYRQYFHTVRTPMPELDIFRTRAAGWYTRSRQVAEEIDPDQIPVLSDQKAMLALPEFINTAIDRRSQLVALMPSMIANSASGSGGFLLSFKNYSYVAEVGEYNGCEYPMKMETGMRADVTPLLKGQNGTMPSADDSRFIFVGCIRTVLCALGVRLASPALLIGYS